MTDFQRCLIAAMGSAYLKKADRAPWTTTSTELAGGEQ